MLGLELKKKSAIHKNQNVIYILHFIQTTLNINCELVILNSFTGVVMALTGFVLMMLVVCNGTNNQTNLVSFRSGNTIVAELHGEVGWPAMVNQNTLKEKTSSGMQGVNNEWCTLLHLLGCCLLSQAYLQSSWGSTEKKVNEAISCFF
ncbi:uncharacterized protein LOC128133863 [Lactuca sativa]|uniref:uncharacterized protein LOC128133863 n=1 Tax=Lactuca sativa TaxID=4236 RepID=UPI0022AFFAE9|nr:uncharacterized protein LOC128133863 [Lactuca sativa]